MATTPTMPGAGYEENLYRGQAMAQLRILKQQMAIGGLKIGSRRVDLGNGVTCFCNICFNKEDVYVMVPRVGGGEEVTTESFTGIIIHPRSGGIEPFQYTEYVSTDFGSIAEIHYMYGVAGGWLDGVTPYSTQYIYPMNATGNTNFVKGLHTKTVTKTGSDPKETVTEVAKFVAPGLYGNLYWDNGAVWDAETETWDKPYIALSWKGTPTRHFRLPSNIEIPGFSTFETSVPGMIEDKPEYTAFGTKLYCRGLVVAEAPHYSWPYNNSGVNGRCLILGAMRNTQGVTYIVCQSDHKLAPSFIWQYSDGVVKSGETETYLAENPLVTLVHTRELTSPGFFIGLWKRGKYTELFSVDGWGLVSEHAYSRNGLPWFGKADGTEFVCGNGDTLSAVGLLTQMPLSAYGVADDTGDWITDTGDYWFDTHYDFILPSTQAFHEFLGNTPAQALRQINAVFTSTSSYTHEVVTNDDIGEVYLTGYPTDGYLSGAIGDLVPLAVGDYIYANWNVNIGFCDYLTEWVVSGFTYTFPAGEVTTSKELRHDVIKVMSVECGTGSVQAFCGIGNATASSPVRLRDLSVTDTANSVCTITGSSMGNAYLTNGSSLYRVYWGKSQIPTDLVVTTLTSAAGNFVYSTIKCGNMQSPDAWVESPYAALDVWVTVPQGIRKVEQVSRFCNTPSAMVYNATPRTWVTADNTTHFFRVSLNWHQGTTTYVRCVTQQSGGYCNNWLSDSFKSGLVDSLGNPVIVPDSVDGYLVKVHKVETLLCS